MRASPPSALLLCVLLGCSGEAEGAASAALVAAQPEGFGRVAATYEQAEPSEEALRADDDVRAAGIWTVLSTPFLGRSVAYAPDATLLARGADGTETTLASDVIPGVAISDDGARLAYLKRLERDFTLHVRTAEEDQIIARLGSAAAPTFSPDGRWIVLLGNIRGGVAGVIAVDAADGSVHALTNGALRAGRAWAPGAFTPLPRAGSMRVDADGYVRWIGDTDGLEHARALPDGGSSR